MEKDERDAVALLQQMQALQHAKQQKRMQKQNERQEERKKVMAKQGALDAQKHKERMKHIYKIEGQREAKRAKSS